jgi:peptidoglycan/LPS O-acetylase OafA/YrhL
VADPARADRVVALDYLRGCVIVLVVLHHSILAYCRYGHFDPRHYLLSSAPIVDSTKWLGFDLIVLFNDGFFMPLMFLLSGWFVWHGLNGKGAGRYARDRLLRLGVPFAVTVLTVIPLAYYPSFRMTGATPGVFEFWSGMILSGPWPSGPAWFLSLLLTFDLAAAAWHASGWRVAIRLPAGAPARCALLLLVSAIAYLPLLVLFGPWHWFSVGPFAVQASRIGLYGVYFLAGAIAGARGLSGAPRAWAGWAALALALFVCCVAVQGARLAGWMTLSPTAWLLLYGIGLLLFCAAANFTFLAVFSRFAQSGTTWGQSLAANAYGIYLVHYAAVTWLQYALLAVPLGPIAKATLVFVLALSSSWAATFALRRIPTVARVI